MEKDVTYRYAVTGPNNDLVDIKDITEDCRGNEYRCLGCNRLMSFVIPQKHPEHQRFFRHLNKCYCNPGIYLHALAEKKIKERFDDKSRPFKIKVPKRIECSSHCELYDKDVCYIKEKSEAYDLHKYYDTCSLEKKVYVDKGKEYYIADIVLKNSEKQQRKNVLIEVFVTHENTEAKRESGLSIIEVNVSKKPGEGEKDIERFCSREIIEEDYYLDGNLREIWNVRMNGFNPQKEFKQLENKNIIRAQLFYSGEYECSTVSCNYLHRSLKGGGYPIFEINMIADNKEISLFYENLKSYAYLYFVDKGYDVVRNCIQCKNAIISKHPLICNLSKSNLTPANPKGPEAFYCPFFEIPNAILSNYKNAEIKFVEVSRKPKKVVKTKLSYKTEEDKLSMWNGIIENERIEKEKERLAREKDEAERIEFERELAEIREARRIRAERLRAELREAARKEAEEKEAEEREAKQKDAEQETEIRKLQQQAEVPMKKAPQIIERQNVKTDWFSFPSQKTTSIKNKSLTNKTNKTNKNTNPYILCPELGLFSNDVDLMLQDYANRLSSYSVFFSKGDVNKVILQSVYLKEKKCIFIIGTIAESYFYSIYKITFLENKGFNHELICNSNDYNEIFNKLQEFIKNTK